MRLADQGAAPGPTQRERGKHTVSKHRTGRPLERHAPAVGQGRVRWKGVCCRAAFTETRSRYAHAVTYTRGEGMVFRGDGKPSRVLFLTGTAGSFLVTLCLWLSCFIRGIMLFLGLGHLSHQPVHVGLDVCQYLSHMSCGHCFLDVH